MSHKAAFWIAVVIVLFFVQDAVLRDWAWSIVLIEQGLEFMHWTMFWR